jgi:hypothetical protein
LVVAVVAAVGTQAGWKGYLGTPVGQVAILDPERYEKYRWLRSRTRPQEWFFEAGDTDIYFLLGLRNPAEVAFLTPTEYTRPGQVENVLKALEERRVRVVLWPPWLDLPQDGPPGDHLGPVRDYLGRRYGVVKTFGDGEQVWERR